MYNLEAGNQIYYLRIDTFLLCRSDISSFYILGQLGLCCQNSAGFEEYYYNSSFSNRISSFLSRGVVHTNTNKKEQDFVSSMYESEGNDDTALKRNSVL